MIVVTIVISSLALFISWLVYQHSRNTFSFQLLEGRYKVYKEILNFCSHFSRHLDFNKENYEHIQSAAIKSFRGEGYYFMTSLFGEDIQSTLEKLNKVYAFFHTDMNVRSSGENDSFKQQNEEKWKEYTNFIVDLHENLPEIFKSYIYFGDYKINRPFKHKIRGYANVLKSSINWCYIQSKKIVLSALKLAACHKTICSFLVKLKNAAKLRKS